MTIKINDPAVQGMINDRLRSGAFRNAEEVVAEALRSFAASPGFPSLHQDEPAEDIEQLFAPLRGLNLDFSRNPSSGRATDL